jgi:serine/threonine protein kinase
MAMVDQHSNSFGSYSSLVTDAYSKQFGSSATPIHPPEQWTDYSFLAFLGLAQRLHVDFLPITWQGSLGLLGRGGQAQVNQALINQAMGFAFKRFDHIRPQDPLRETVQEMLVLTHPLVRSHEHIVRLEGICWDIPQDDQVWPALVFEKTQFGDLHAFSKSKRFQAMAMGEKLELCADIGLAIRDMHYNGSTLASKLHTVTYCMIGIIHGDIKPENVLVFEGAVQPLCARVGDFGYSTWFRGANNLILMPKSVPWCAPEHEGQKFHPLQAKQMDTYSFGMLCIWLLFEAGSSGSLPLHPDVVQGNDQCVTFEKPFPKNNLLDTWKNERSDMLVHWAQWLLLESTHFGGDMKDNLTQFFQSTLAMDPQERNTDFTELIFLLSPYR